MQNKTIEQMNFLPLPPKEWVEKNPQIFRFEIEPLDVELAKLTFEMTKRLPEELPQKGTFEPIVEQYLPNKGWYMNLGLIEMTCCCLDESDERLLFITFWDKEQQSSYRYLLQQGTTQDMLDCINEHRILFRVKGRALWTNKLLKV